ncbi:hypothetical protein KY311_04760, partial [Candidatus Woesearchaeota archaeon]|nr:hypothetical protein [Candidatus Woesearchaeota archaeon]
YDRIIDIQKACLGRVLVRVGIEEVINGYYKAVPKETVVFREKGSKDFDDMTIDEKIELISFGPKAVGCSKPVKDLIFDIEDKKLVSPELAVKLLKAINEHYKQGECCTGREETLHTYCYAFGKAIREQCSKEQLAEIALTDPETFAKIFKGKNE